MRKWYSFKSISSNRTVANCQTLSMHGMMSSSWSIWPVWVCNHRSRPGASFITVICMRLSIFVIVRHRFQYFVGLVSLCDCTHCWPVWSFHQPVGLNALHWDPKKINSRKNLEIFHVFCSVWYKYLIFWFEYGDLNFQSMKFPLSISSIFKWRRLTPWKTNRKINNDFQ